MIKTKLFEGYILQENKPKYIGVDEEINMFIQENPDIDIIDIKFSSNDDGDEIIYGALLIYKEVK